MMGVLTAARICMGLVALLALAMPLSAQINKAREQAERVTEQSGGSNNLPPKDEIPKQNEDAKQKEEKSKPTIQKQQQQKQPQEQKQQNKITKPQQPPIEQAIEKLTEEYQSYLKDGSPEPRKASEYFSTTSSDEVTQEKIVEAMQKPIHGDPRVAAYVKWQLLSGVPDKFDDKLVNQALRAYRNAPKPLPRPGLEPAQQKQLDSAVKNLKEGQGAALQTQLKEAIEKSMRENQPIYDYRNELFVRLPQRPDVFEAGLVDAQARVNTGGSHTELLDNLASSIRSWAMNASPQQIKGLANGLRKVSDMRGPTYYEILQWESNRYKWETRQAILDEGKRLSELAADLEDQADPKKQLKVR